MAGSVRGIVERYEPMDIFAFRWEASGADAADESVILDDSNSTVVTFTISDIDGGARLHVAETGFASLPDAIRATVHRENVSGWDSELGELADLLAKQETG